MSKRNRTTSPDLINKRMNSDVYALRRKVINIIYEAKKLHPALPRIEVRICDSHNRILGQAAVKGCVIWITESSVKKPALALRHVVMHEICHTVFGTDHFDDCLLMHPVIQKTTKAQQNKAFLKHALDSGAPLALVS